MIEARGYAVELTRDRLIGFYEAMLTGRIAEQHLVDMARRGEQAAETYPGVGQEAAMVGFAGALDDDDVFAGTRRGMAARLARGVALEAILLDVFGKAVPAAALRSGAFLEAGPAGAGSCPVAVGCALAFRQRSEARVAMSHVGDGATASGAWHEAVNLAAAHRLPVVFAVESNGYAGATRTARGSALAYLAHRADGYGIPGVVVDGNDLLDVYAAAREAVERARAGEGPTVIEAVTFRILGHTAHDEAGYVDPDERADWEGRDPIARFEEYLGVMGHLDEPRRAHIRARIDDAVGAAFQAALSGGDPGRPAGETPVAPGPAAPPAKGEAGSQEMTLDEAVHAALRDEMERDERVFLIGHDLARPGAGRDRWSRLLDHFGPRRVVDTPVSDAAVVGAAVGAALLGRRPVADVGATEYLWQAAAQVFGQAARHHGAAGRAVPLVLRVPTRPGPSGSPEGLLAQHPGVKVVVPASPAAGRALLIGAIRDPSPVVFLEPEALSGVAGDVPGRDHVIAPGTAAIARPGDDATVVAWGAAVPVCLEAAATLGAEGISVEVIDLQSLVPVDWATVLESVVRTARLVVVHEAAWFAGIGAEVAARAAAEAMWDLDGPILRVAPAPSAESGLTPIAVTDAVRSLGRS